jgi:DNA-directed RNA polymerase alpha subunit
MSTVFVLKPIIDVLYNEVNEYKKEIERLNKIIDELKGRKFHKKVEVIEVESKKNEIIDLTDSDYDSDDDEKYAKQAEAPPASSPVYECEQEENKNNNNENVSSSNDDIKKVKMIGGKEKKEYMKEYQRTYRKKQKELRAES